LKPVIVERLAWVDVPARLPTSRLTFLIEIAREQKMGEPVRPAEAKQWPLG
jgi:hypothetical protein